jgi:sigma-B regulation protein RsbU (phosphoserine phosphatase)
LLATFTSYSYWREKNQTREKAKNKARQEAIRTAKEIDTQLRKLQDSVNSIADELTTGKLKDGQLLDRLKSTIEQNPSWFQVGAAYAPYAYNPKIRLYSPYYIRKQGKVQMLPLEPPYDYS